MKKTDQKRRAKVLPKGVPPSTVVDGHSRTEPDILAELFGPQLLPDQSLKGHTLLDALEIAESALPLLAVRAKEYGGDWVKRLHRLAMLATKALLEAGKSLPTANDHDFWFGLDDGWTSVPVIIDMDGSKDFKALVNLLKKDAAAVGLKLDARGKHGKHVTTHQSVRKSAESLVQVLDKLRSDGDPHWQLNWSHKITFVLRPDGWTPPGSSQFKGWRDAAAMLPPPSTKTAALWVQVAEAMLVTELSSNWFENDKIINLAWRNTPPLDRKARRMNIEKGYLAAVKSAVKRLQPINRLPSNAP